MGQGQAPAFGVREEGMHDRKSWIEHRLNEIVDQSGKKGWQKLDGPQRGQVHAGLIWQDAVGA